MATTSVQSRDTAVAVETRSADPIREFAEELDTLLCRWRDRAGFHWEQTTSYPYIDQEPEGGYARQRRGPQARIVLVVTEMTRIDELAAAYYQDGTRADSPRTVSRDRSAVAEKLRDDPLTIGADGRISEIDQDREPVIAVEANRPGIENQPL